MWVAFLWCLDMQLLDNDWQAGTTSGLQQSTRTHCRVLSAPTSMVVPALSTSSQVMKLKGCSSGSQCRWLW
jgi:hypothetical protein